MRFNSIVKISITILGVVLLSSIWFNVSVSYTNTHVDKLKQSILNLSIKCDSLENIVTNYQTKCDTIIINILPQPLKIYQHVGMSIDSCYLNCINYRNE